MEISQFSHNSLSEREIKKADAHQKQLKDLQNLSKAEYALETMSDKEISDLKEASRGIEQIFVKMLTDQMRKSIQREQSDSSAQNQGRDIFEEMLYDEYGKKLTQQGGFGIADAIFRQLTTPVIRPQDIEKFYQNHNVSGAKKE